MRAIQKVKQENDKRLDKEKMEQQARWIKEKTNWDLISKDVISRITINELLNEKNENVITKIT